MTTETQAPDPAPLTIYISRMDAETLRSRGRCTLTAYTERVGNESNEVALTTIPAPEGAQLPPDQLADKCEAWLQAGGASNIVDAYEAGYREAERAALAAPANRMHLAKLYNAGWSDHEAGNSYRPGEALTAWLAAPAPKDSLDSAQPSKGVAMQAPQAPAWQPIETAPKERGGLVDIICNERRYTGCHYDRICDEYRHITACGVLIRLKGATHWMPIPAAPQTKEPKA